MGAIVLRSTDDCIKYDCDVGVTCCACGRLADFDATDWEVSIGRSLETLGSPFRCKCGSRLISVKPINQCERPAPLPKRRAPLVPLYVKRGWRRSR